MSHDPIKFANGLGAKLAARSRHVCAFLGAGVARACGLPDISQLQTKVVAGLTGTEKAAFTKQLAGRNLEQALSRLRRIAALASGTETIDGLTSTQAATLDTSVCKLIVTNLSLDKADLTPVHRLAAWAGQCNYVLPVEIFTVNYDLLLETALERFKVPYFDGFVGTLRAQFQTELSEATSSADRDWLPSFFVRLWKLHGSVNWAWENQQIVRLGQPVAGAAAIYPSDAKYEESRRVPFVVLQDRFRRALHMPETLVLISGYSFGDAHLNEMIFDAAARRARSEILTFCRSKIPEVLAQRAATTPNIQVVTGKEAILGGVRAEWAAPSDPAPGIWESNELALKEFAPLATFLARSIALDRTSDPVLKDPLVLPKSDPASLPPANA